MGPLVPVDNPPLPDSIGSYLETLPSDAQGCAFGGSGALPDDVLIALQQAVG